MPKETPDKALPSRLPEESRSTPRAGPARPLSDVELLAEIGRELRAVYDDLFREPVPEHLAAIIEKLEGGGKEVKR